MRLTAKITLQMKYCSALCSMQDEPAPFVPDAIEQLSKVHPFSRFGTVLLPFDLSVASTRVTLSDFSGGGQES